MRWYKNNVLLADSADPHLLLPLNTRMHANYSLQVDALTAADTADYTCEVSSVALGSGIATNLPNTLLHTVHAK